MRVREHTGCTGDVGVHVAGRISDAGAHAGLASEVNHADGLVFIERALHRGVVADVDFEQRPPITQADLVCVAQLDRTFVVGIEVVKTDDGHAALG